MRLPLVTFSRLRLKALLHRAVFCATCLATFKSVALQLHEQGCYTVQWDCQQLANLRPRRTEERIIRILIGWSSKALWDKLLEGWLHCATAIESCCNRRTEFYFVQRCAQHRAILQQFLSQRRCETSCWKNCSVTPPLRLKHEIYRWTHCLDRTQKWQNPQTHVQLPREDRGRNGTSEISEQTF